MRYSSRWTSYEGSRPSYLLALFCQSIPPSESIEVFLSLGLGVPWRLLLAQVVQRGPMGGEADHALPAHQGVPLAGRSYSLCREGALTNRFPTKALLHIGFRSAHGA